MPVRTVEDLRPADISGHRILVRVDFNVPLSDQGRITDDRRIVQALPTLRFLLDRGGRVVVISHLGRPKGEADPAASLRPVADHLSEVLGDSVEFCPRLVGEEARAAVSGLNPGRTLVLENTRFDPGETRNDPGLAESLGEFGDVFVNDAFGSAHRAHASTVGVAQVIRAKGGPVVAGFLMEKELEYLQSSLETPRRPFVAVLGGAKISGKIDLIHALLPKVDRLLVGGAMANTFFKAMGLDVGGSLVEDDRLDMAGGLLEEAGETILLPVDCVVSEEITADAATRVVDRSQVGAGDRIGDIGPGSRELFAEALRGSGTVVWNGPMGVFELPPFAQGTLSLAEAVADVTDEGGVTIVGGGDSAAAAEAAGVSHRLTHVSTGGGASLELLSGQRLPGVEALDRKEAEAE